MNDTNMECKGIYILKASRVKYLSVKIYQNMKKANGKLKVLVSAGANF